MFGALNRFISRLDAAGEPESTQTSSLHNASGFQVLRNTNPELQLDPWFDFIIGINGRTIDNPSPELLSTEIRNCAGSTISLGIFSAKGQKIRETYAQVPSDTGSLGISLQWTPLSVTEDVWHILDVIPNSPADVAGLLPYGDYVIGSPEGNVRGEGGLGELVEDFLDRPLRLLVYNHEYACTRPITITPSRTWGGTGALGCVLGFGALHRIPPPLDEPPNGPGETLFETAYTDEKRPISSSSNTTPSFSAGVPPPVPIGGDFLVPANLPIKATSPPPPSGGPPAGGKKTKARAHHHHFASPTSAIDEYFKEGEEKSKEQDLAPGSKSGSVPPPPKGAVGGPPKGPPPRGVSPGPKPAAANEGEDGEA